jgi:hypothetical protein
VSPGLQQSLLFRIYDGVPVTWSIDQCEQMSSILLGDVDAEELRLDFFSLEALDRFVTAAKQARRRLRMRITATEQAIAAGYAS